MVVGTNFYKVFGYDAILAENRTHRDRMRSRRRGFLYSPWYLAKILVRRLQYMAENRTTVAAAVASSGLPGSRAEWVAGTLVVARPPRIKII